MTATTLIPERISNIAGPRLSAVLTPIHDAWMADADRFLIPVTDSNATFWDRWAAVRYAGDLFQDRLRLEKAFLREVRPFLTPKLNARLWMQVDRIERLHGDLVHLAYQRGTARELAHSARQLLEAVRLWYAEFEFALSGTREEDLGKRPAQLLAELRKGRRFELCDLCEV
jgi:hypothetical protein